MTAEMMLTIGQSTHMSTEQIAEVLGEVPFLSHVSTKRRLKLIDDGFLRSYESGEKIIREGDHGHSLFVLLTGSVSVQATAVDGTPMKLATFARPGTYFGEAAILGRTRRSATLTANFRSVVLEIEKITLEKLDNAEEGVLERLEHTFEQRAVETFLGRHSGFSQLTEGERKELVEDASLESASREDAIFSEGDVANTVLILKAGSAQLLRGRKSVLAYFSAGDVVGLFDGAKRPGTLAALEFVEYVVVAKDVFQKVQKSADARTLGTTGSAWSDQFRKSVDPESVVVVEGSFLPHLVADAAHQARSLLTIDLDLCIRCGNCTRSCEARHGYPKMTRRGKKLQRGPEYGNQPILLPSSCRHCETPECMIGCPTGAIHRKPTGEVAIHDFCIGCSNCAIRCPWDNITMVSTPGRFVADLATPKIASKCDLCFGYDEANCVNNCPTQAILRIDPVTYFPEVAEALNKADRTTFHRTAAAEKKDRSRAAIWSVAAVLAGIMVALYLLAEPYYPFSTSGFVLGGLAFTFMLSATALAARRRINHWPKQAPHPDKPADQAQAGKAQLGPFYLWARAHVAVGVLALIAVALHSGFSLGGFVTSMLIFLLGAEVLTGLFGVTFYKWWPKQVTRLERGSQVEEDLVDELARLDERTEELSASTEAAGAVRVRASLLACLSKRYDSQAAEAEALKSLGTLPRDPVQAAPLETLAKDAVRRAEIRAIRWLYRVRRGWLAIHIGVTAMLLTMAVVHVASVAAFYVRF